MPTIDPTIDDFLNAFIQQVTMLFSDSDMAKPVTADDAMLMLQTLTIMTRALIDKNV